MATLAVASVNALLCLASTCFAVGIDRMQRNFEPTVSDAADYLVSVIPLAPQGGAQGSDKFFLLTIVPHLPHSVFAYVEAVPYTFT
jgi:hypothetical protein